MKWTVLSNQTVFFLNLHDIQTLVHSFPFTFWSLKSSRRVVESVTKTRYKLRVFPPCSEPHAGGELSDLFGRECSGCWDAQEPWGFGKIWGFPFWRDNISTKTKNMNKRYQETRRNISKHINKNWTNLKYKIWKHINQETRKFNHVSDGFYIIFIVTFVPSTWGLSQGDWQPAQHRP